MTTFEQLEQAVAAAQFPCIAWYHISFNLQAFPLSC
jgi:hypothetical protein